jgi:hypothetical protein
VILGITGYEDIIELATSMIIAIFSNFLYFLYVTELRISIKHVEDV